MHNSECQSKYNAVRNVTAMAHTRFCSLNWPFFTSRENGENIILFPGVPRISMALIIEYNKYLIKCHRIRMRTGLFYLIKLNYIFYD